MMEIELNVPFLEMVAYDRFGFLYPGHITVVMKEFT